MERPSGGAECRSFHGQEGQKPSVNLLGLFGENRCDRFKIMGAKLDVGEGIRFISRSVLSRMGANVTSQGRVTNVEHIVGYLLCFGQKREVLALRYLLAPRQLQYLYLLHCPQNFR